jgi:UDP:flavonoid glycosyltransferase YjiC (YdhE family)
MIASGSRGDLQAFVALGKGLAAAGHEVTVATHAPFESIVRDHGLAFHRLSGDSEQFFRGIAGVALREKWRNPRTLLSFCERFLGPFIDRFLNEALEVCREADAVLYWPFLRIGPSIAEALRIPCFGVSHYPLPYQRTGAFANSFFSPLRRMEQFPWPLAQIYNRFTYAVVEPFFWRIFRENVNRWRREALGLKPLTGREEGRRVRALPHLLGYSANVLPAPKNWPRQTHVTGYWTLMDREAPVPPPGLEEFLADGPTPVCIGFGSMVGRRPEELTQLSVDALDRAGTRGVLLTGWGGLTTTTLPPSVFQVESVAHEWLYPRVAAVVHHGGSGTTAAAVRAGVPSIITPFGFDQSLWGRRIAELGIGTEPIPQQELTVERLADAIRIATRTESMRSRAAALAIKVRRENGVGRAIELFNQYAEVPF